MPREVFVAGQVLTAAELNVVSDQSVMVFAGTAARGSAIPSPTEGMVTYREDDDVVEVFDGSIFRQLGGAILQVVSAVKTDVFSASVTVPNFSSAIFSASITPRSTSNKILVLVNFSASSSGGSGTYAGLFRDTVISDFRGDAASNRQRVATAVGGAGINAVIPFNGVIVYLDSPNTTSSVTYDLRLGASTSGTVYLNRSSDDTDSNAYPRSASSITLMEVAG